MKTTKLTLTLLAIVATTDIAEPAAVSAHDSDAIAPTPLAATKRHPLREEGSAALAPIPAPPKKSLPRRDSALRPYPPAALRSPAPHPHHRLHSIPQRIGVADHAPIHSDSLQHPASARSPLRNLR